MPQSELVQSVFAFAIREINALEFRIVKSEDDADAMLWDQAAQVVVQLEAGLSQGDLAAQWINARTGLPYSQMHVSRTARVFRLNVNVSAELRPRFRDAFNEVANASTVHVAQHTGYFEWYTPPAYIEAARSVLGEIDLDPASSAPANDVVKASQFFSLADDGLAQPWHGRVWLNPPYAQPLIAHFADKLAASVRAGDVTAAVVLVNNATETDWFCTLASTASAICFPEGRVRFWTPAREAESVPLQGQAVLYTGPARDRFCQEFGSFGVVLVKA